MQLLYFWRCDMSFTGEERVFCTLQFEATRSIKTTMRKFTSKFKKKFSSNRSIKKWHSNFVNTGNSTTPRKAPTPTVCTPEAAAAISEHFEEIQHCSIRRASLALEMKKSSVQKIVWTIKIISAYFLRTICVVKIYLTNNYLWELDLHIYITIIYSVVTCNDILLLLYILIFIYMHGNILYFINLYTLIFYY